MRFRVDITVDQLEMDRDYRRNFMSLFKFALSHYQDGQYYDVFYGEGVKQKDFSFAVFFQKPVFSKQRIGFARPDIALVVAASDKKQGILLFNSLMAVKQKKHLLSHGNAMTVKRVKLVNEKIIQGNVAQFKLLSPICLRTHQKEGNTDWYYSIASDEFVPMLKETLKTQLARYDQRLVKLMDDLKVDTRLCKKTVVNHYGCLIEATIGEIIFYGEPSLLNGIQAVNLGVRQNAGFGLLELKEDWEVI